MDYGAPTNQIRGELLSVMLSPLVPSDPALASFRELSWRIEDRNVTSFVLVFSHPEPRIDGDSGLKPAE